MNNLISEEELREIWREALSLDIKDIDIINKDTNFFDIGGTSLLIGIMNILIIQRVGYTVLPEFFYRNPTFGKMLEELTKIGNGNTEK